MTWVALDRRLRVRFGCGPILQHEPATSASGEQCCCRSGVGLLRQALGQALDVEPRVFLGFSPVIVNGAARRARVEEPVIVGLELFEVTSGVVIREG
jgi:hypothetical protein